jgi:major intracellular serine protease
MFNIDNLQIDSTIIPKVEDTKFLTLSGRELFHKQNIKGEGVIVAVIDTGVSNHPEFEDRLLPGVNLNKSYSNKNDYSDDGGHGTHVAATIAGKTCGIAPKAKILPVKVLHPMNGCNLLELIDSLKYVRDWRGSNGEKVDIVNMSLSASGTYMDSRPTEKEIIHRLIIELTKMDILVVCASGNSGKEEIRYPGHFEEVVCVGAVDIDKQVAHFTTKNKVVDLCQIGVDLVSAHYKGGYIKYSGTSMATPMVAGISALIASKYKKIFNKTIPEMVLYESLKLNTIDVGVPGLDVATGAGFCCLNPNPLKLELGIDSDELVVNGITHKMTIPTKLIDGVTMMPIRSVFEAFGSHVGWDGITRKVTIKY